MTIKNLMHPDRTMKFVLSVVVLLGLSGLLYVRGCRVAAKNFVPTSEVAQSAVKQALDAWQAGAAAGEIAGTKPAIVVTDVNRKHSQVLEHFEILGETPGRAGRTFAVRLQLSRPIESIKTEYIVVGIDPLWVFAKWSFTFTESSVSADKEFHCPMDPGVSSVWPAICPICNMDLVPRKKADAIILPEGVMARMQLTPYRVQLAGIRTVPVQQIKIGEEPEEQSALQIPITSAINRDSEQIVYAVKDAQQHHGETHHGMPSVSNLPIIDPHPKFDLIVRSLTERFAKRIWLWPHDSDTLAVEMDVALQVPGWANVWTKPIQNRIDMLATGVNSEVGIRVLGPDLDDVVLTSEVIAGVVREISGATDVIADPIRDKNYVDIVVNPERMREHGIDSDEVDYLFETATRGQTFEGTNRDNDMLWIVPISAILIGLFLWATFFDVADAGLMFISVPGALSGGVLCQWFLGFPFSAAVGVGYIACFGMAAATSMIMLVYLRASVASAGGLERLTLPELRTAVIDGAVHRLRPKLLTEATIIFGLAPIMWSTGFGADIIRPMAAPVLGGILIADEVVDLLIPIVFFAVRRRRWQRHHSSISHHTSIS